MMEENEILKRLRSFRNPEALAGMARFGSRPKNAYGITIPTLRKMAKPLGKNHRIARQLWQSGIHEARILATMVEDPERVTEKQVEKWVRDFDSWDIVDQCCTNLLTRTRWAHPKALEWSGRKEEYVKRAGFVLMAVLAVHDKKTSDREFLQFFPLIQREAKDERNFVKKAVNWALRQVGKRSLLLHEKAVQAARKIHEVDSRSARWIAADALRELNSEKIRKRLRMRQHSVSRRP
jgi:3-methyladenine DNA glycosylase AlkD